MPINIVMPKLGLTMEEGLITEWVKKEGDSVVKGDILFIMETEKITQEVEAPQDGILAKIVAQVQETVPVGEIVAYMLEPGEDPASIPSAGAAATAPVVAEEKPAPQDESRNVPAAVAGARIKASPLARKIARSYNLDLSQVTGTGPSGRIVAADVEKAYQSAKSAPVAAAPVSAAPAAPAAPAAEVELELEAGQTLVPFTSMRKAIAKNMLGSKRESASTYMYNTVDASKLQEMRDTLLPYMEKKYGVRITITDLVMKITAVALREHPVLNTRWTEKGIIFNSKVHMGMAMALDEGLIVLSIKDINSKSIGKIASERIELINKGKTNSFGPDDISGSTFTVSSLGMTGLEQFVSIINQPESAILAVAAIIDKPVVIDGEIAIRPMMNVNLTYDHRVIDGAEAAKFMMTLKEYIENPILAI